MAEPKEIGTVWTLGCEVFIEDALTAEVQEIKVNDIALSANVFTEGLSVDVGSDRVNAMDLDVRISMDGLKTYIIDSQIVPYEDVLKITDFSPEATNEKRYASSANTSKKIIDSVDELEGRVNVAEGDIDSLERRLNRLESNGTGGGSGDGFWYLNEQDGKIHTDIGIVVHGDAIVEGDTSSEGDGEDVVVGIQGVRVNGTTHFDEDGDGVVDLGTIESGGGGLTSVSWGDIQGTPPSVSTFNNDVPYVTDEELKPLGEEIELLSSMWHIDSNGNLVTDKQVIIRNNLIVEQDTSSGGDGADTPSGGISGVRVNGVTYYDDNGDGIVDLGTISGGGGTADLSNYYTKSQSDARYLAQSGGTITGDLYLNQYLHINAWSGYGSGAASAWYNGNTQMLLWENVSGMGLGSNVVLHSGNIGSYAFVPKSEIINNTDADYLLTNGVYLNATGNGSGNENIPVSYSILTTFTQSNNYAAQLSIGNGIFHFRRKIDTWSDWAEVIHSGNIGSQSVASAKSLVASDGTTYVSYNSTYGQVNVKGINIGYGGNTIETASGGVLNIQSNSTGGTIISPYGGNVGIGTTSPLSKLQVGGQINVSHNSNKNYAFISQDDYTSNTSWMKLGTCYGYQTEAVAMTIYQGMVKIGNAIPTCELDVNGGIKATKPIFGYMYGTNNNAAAFIFDKPGLNYTGIGSDGVTDTIRFGACNEQGGWVDYNQKWKFYGDIIVTGDTSSGSDIRFKDVIKNKTIKIEHIAKAPLFTFKWNDREDDSVHLGSSAQYWEKVTPWLVKGDDFKTLDYSTLGVAMGISLAKKAVNHEARIKELEKEIKRLKEEMR